MRRIYDALGRDDFGWREALAVVEANPGWSDLNRHVEQKVSRHHDRSDARPARIGDSSSARMHRRRERDRAHDADARARPGVARCRWPRRWLVADGAGRPPRADRAEGIEMVSIAASAGQPGRRGALRARALAGDPEAAAVVDGAPVRQRLSRRPRRQPRRVLLIADRGRPRRRTRSASSSTRTRMPTGAAYPADATCRFLLGHALHAPPPRVHGRSAAARARPGRRAQDPGDVRWRRPDRHDGRTVDALRARLPETLRGRSSRSGSSSAPPIATSRGHRRRRRRARTSAIGRSLERAVDDMPAAMAWADLAITSGGSTVWELARIGCPALVVETVPVEKALVTGLAIASGCSASSGPRRELDDAQAWQTRSRRRPKICRGERRCPSSACASSTGEARDGSSTRWPAGGATSSEEGT